MTRLPLADLALLGLCSGALGSVAMNAWGLFTRFVLHISRTWSAQLMTEVILRHPAHEPLEYAVGLLYDMVFDGAVGALLGLSLRLLGTRHLHVLGWFFGVLISLATLLVTALFRIPIFIRLEARETLSHFVTASMWGIVTSHFLLILLRRRAHDERPPA